MKTLYVNINDETIHSNNELEVLNHDLDGDFFFYLGEKIAKGCKVENENALITDFNTQENKDDYQQMISQWNELKAILLSEECKGDFEFTLPNGYIHWLKYHPQYVSIYDKNFSHSESGVIPIDLQELYEESLEELQRYILRKLKKDDLYTDVDEIVFNDDAVSRKSPIIRTLKSIYEGIGFKTYKKWKKDRQNQPQEPEPHPAPHPQENRTTNSLGTVKPVNKKSTAIVNDITTFITFLYQSHFLFVDENRDLILRFPSNINFKEGKYAEMSAWCVFFKLWKIFEHKYKTTHLHSQTGMPSKIMELLKDEVIHVIDEEITLRLKKCTLEKFLDDFGNEIESNYINLSRYLRHSLRFDYLDNNMTKTFVSWEQHAKIYFGYITQTKLLCDDIYKKIAVVNNGELIVISDGSKNYFMNYDTRQILPLEFENIPRFYEGLAKVQIKGKWGYIDVLLNMVIQPQYEVASNFSNATARVTLKGKGYLINKKGELFEGFVPLNKR